MHIIIPMSGIGKRFLDAGYSEPKPLIHVEGKPIIAHVIEMFPGESKFTFICNEDHLANTNLKAVLLDLADNANILSIASHKKGPVFAVSKIYDFIDDQEEVIVNYCDFGKDWSYKKFLNDIHKNQADGSISAYRGFHPHMLGKINYAFMREENNWMLEIQEKKPFTNNRMQEYASDGTYYFRTGAILKKYFDLVMQRDISLSGEYYVSVVYNLLVEAGLKVRIFEIEHMLQWGTPGELEEYIYWSNIFKGLAKEKKRQATIPNRINLIPMAGKGSRFSIEGYTTPKPLIPVDGNAMVVQAARSLPDAERNIFICLSEHLKQYPLGDTLNNAFPNCKIVGIQQVTEGQAITASLGLQDENPDCSLMIAASDNGMLYDNEKLEQYTRDQSVDVIVFTFRGNPTSKIHPEMYGWVKRKNDNATVATAVSVKIPISDNPIQDDAIVGAFYFRSVALYEKILKELLAKNIRVNQEFYIDSMIGVAIEMGFRVKIFPVEHYICWGTPNDYKTYLYWQNFFSKTKWHPYNK